MDAIFLGMLDFFPRWSAATVCIDKISRRITALNFVIDCAWIGLIFIVFEQTFSLPSHSVTYLSALGIVLNKSLMLSILGRWLAVYQGSWRLTDFLLLRQKQYFYIFKMNGFTHSNVLSVHISAKYTFKCSKCAY